MHNIPEKINPFIEVDTSLSLVKIGKSLDKTPSLYSDTVINLDKTFHKSSNKFFTETNNNVKIECKTQNNQIDNNSIFLLIIPILLSLWILTISFSKIQGAFKSLFNNRQVSIFMRNYNVKSYFSTYLIYFTSAINIVFLLWVWFLQNNSDLFSIRYLLLHKIIFLIFLYFIYRYVLIFIFEKIFKTADATNEYVYRDYFTKAVFAIIFPFLTFITAYSPYKTITWSFILFFAVLLIISRIYNSIVVGFKEKTYGLFYFILYICTVEIVPVLFLIKILSKYIST
ncbi:MAG: DUF4271 domain-containing protein [Bacteroidales bacterium]|nr:DUF4271 domain-containing protein [Bacteroidales bacterium]